MEEYIFRVQKLESVGILAGGIAHDFNNLLTAILGNVSLAKSLASSQSKIVERLIEAEKASLRAKELAQQLLTFSRGGSPIKKVASLADLIQESSRFALAGSNVHCEFFIPDDLWPVEVDEGQITQVLQNLIINADQAMPEGGRLKVTCSNIVTGEHIALALKPGRYVRIAIEDQGMGMSEDQLQKIFETYFTTKEKGRGLGLATAYTIIKNHDGYIVARSELEVGSTFEIYLPASESQNTHEKCDDKMNFAGRGTVLVMDDEEMVRELAGAMLEHLGYKAEFAKDGAEAIEIFRKAKESTKPFDAIMMDLTVPGGMGGKDAIKALIEIDPKVKAVVSSGYSSDPIMSEYRKYGFSGVLSKPFKIEDLSRVLHEVTEQSVDCSG